MQTTVADLIAALTALPGDTPVAIEAGGPLVSPVRVTVIDAVLNPAQDRDWNERDLPAIRPREADKPFVYYQVGTASARDAAKAGGETVRVVTFRYGVA
jgi:hypothetical protein